MNYRYKTETLSLVWVKADDEVPPTGVNIYFQLAGSKDIKKGFLASFTGVKKIFYSDGLNYNLFEVSYWCYPPQLKGVK